jgi:hypothetical protein
VKLTGFTLSPVIFVVDLTSCAFIAAVKATVSATVTLETNLMCLFPPSKNMSGIRMHGSGQPTPTRITGVFEED